MFDPICFCVTRGRLPFALEHWQINRMPEALKGVYIQLLVGPAVCLLDRPEDVGEYLRCFRPIHLRAQPEFLALAPAILALPGVPISLPFRLRAIRHSRRYLLRRIAISLSCECGENS